MSAPPQNAPKRARRKRSFFRRYVVRTLGWGVAVVAILCLLAGRLVDTGPVRERLRAFAASTLSERLEVAVRVGGIEVNLAPLQVEVTELEIDGRDGQPLLVVPSGTLRAHLEGWLRPRVTLYKVELERPEVDLRFDETGGSNVPIFRRRDGAGSGRVTVRLRELEVEAGELRLDHLKIPLDLDAVGLEADLVGLGKNATQGTVRFDALSLGLAGGQADLGAVEVRARTLEGGLEIDSGTLTGDDLRGSFDGSWSWQDAKPGALAVDASVDLALVRRLGLLKTPASGQVRWVGDVLWDRTTWAATGRATSADLYALGRDLRDVDAEVRASPELVDLSRFTAVYGEGEVAGSMRIEREGRGLTELDLQLSEIDLRPLLADQSSPVRRLAATLSGDLRYRFFLDSATEGDGWGQFRFEPATPRTAAGVPVAGASTLLIDNGVVTVEALRLRGASQQIDAAGSYDLERRRGQFRYELGTEAPTELLGLLDSPIPPALWLPEAARGTVRGDLFLQPEQVSSFVDLDLVDVRAPGLAADSLTGGLTIDTRLGAQNLHLELENGGAAMLVTGAVPFAAADSGGSLDDEGLDLRIELVEWPSAQLSPWLPFELPLSGPVAGSVELRGAADALVGAAELEIDGVESAGRDLGRIEVAVDFSPGTTEIESLRLVDGECAVAARGRIDGGPTEDGAGGEPALAFVVDSEGCRLGEPPFDSLVPLRADAGLAIAAVVGGTLENPEIEAEIGLSDLTLPELALEAGQTGRLALEWRDGEIEVDGGLPGVLLWEGRGRGGFDAAELEIDLRLSDLATVVALAGGPALDGLEGEGHGVLRLSATPETAPSVTVEWDDLTARYAGRALENLEPIRIAWRPDELAVESIFLGDEEGTADFFVSGTAALPDGELALNLATGLDARWLRLISPDFDMRSGRLDLLANVRGTVGAPHLAGQGSLTGGSVVLPDGVLSLEGLEGLVLFYPTQVVLDRLVSRGAGGRLLASGRVGMPEESEPLDYRFQISGRDLSFRYPEGWLLSGDAELVVGSAPEGRQVEGAITLDRALYARDVSLGINQLMQALFQRQRVEVEEVDELLAETQLNVLVEGPRALRVRNNLADLYGRIDLAIRGTAARPVVFGEVELERGGTFEYSSTEYTIDRGLLSFVNPYRIEPVIDLIAEATTREYEITMNLSGPVDNINATFASDPPLADLEILSLLATGDVGATEPGGESGVDAGTFLYGQAASLIAERANNLFGFDKLRIDPLTGESGRLSSARVTVGKQLSRDFFATYSYDPSATEEQILQLEWQVDRDFSLVFTQNGDGTYAVDAQWEKHF